MDLLHHEVLVSGLFGCLCVPLDLLWLLLDFFAIQVEEGDLALADASHLKVADIVDGPCVLEDRRYI